MAIVIELLALTALPATGTAARAGWLGVRNDLGQAVVVTTALGTAANGEGGASQGTPQRLYPGEVTWTWIRDATPRKLTVADAGPSRSVLASADVTVGKDDVIYAIEHNPGSPAGKRVQIRQSWTGSRNKSPSAKR